jgi:capsular polysaccharide biosynthesis protein
MTHYITLSIVFISTIVTAAQHPTGFTTLNECIAEESLIIFPLPEAPQQFVLALDHGTVVESGAIITKNGKLLRDTETYKKDQHRLLNKKRDITKEKQLFFDGVLAVISSPGQQCYYHWLLQVLPRLKTLVASNLPYDKIYLDGRNITFQWQYDSLYSIMDHLNIPHDRLLFINDGTVVTAKTLLVPSIFWNPAKPNFWTSDLTWFKQFFIDAFIKTSDENTPKKIFISRSSAQYRHISNEKSLVKFLKKQGFVVFHLENLSLHDQAVLFNNAEIIIGPHGAGFTNLIFCKPNTHIVEIDHGINGEQQRSSYQGMAKRMECIYHPFYVDNLEDTDSSEDIMAPINQDMTVDIDAFEAFYHSRFDQEN